MATEISEERRESPEQVQEDDTRAPLPDGGEQSGGTSGFAPLRVAFGRASDTWRKLKGAGGQWANGAEGRVVEIGKELRGQGERAVGEVAKQVERNPLASLAIAFALGFLCATVARLFPTRRPD